MYVYILTSKVGVLEREYAVKKLSPYVSSYYYIYMSSYHYILVLVGARLWSLKRSILSKLRAFYDTNETSMLLTKPLSN